MSSIDLCSLVAPLTTDEFHEHVFRRRALHVPGRLDRFAELLREHFCDGNLDELLEETASEHIFAWMRKAAAGIDLKLGSVELSSAADARTAWSGGASLYFRSSQSACDSIVPGLARSIGFAEGTAERSEIEVFASRKGHVTDWHFDFMENITIQISGRKRWDVRHSRVKHPLRGCTPHYVDDGDTLEQQTKVHRMHCPSFSVREASSPASSPAPGAALAALAFGSGAAPADGAPPPSASVELLPGSVFYFPAGMLHKVTCTEDSLSINISFMAPTWSDIFSEALRQTMWSYDAFRECAVLSDAHWRTRAAAGRGDPARRAPLRAALAKAESSDSPLLALSGDTFPFPATSAAEATSGAKRRRSAADDALKSLREPPRKQQRSSSDCDGERKPSSSRRSDGARAPLQTRVAALLELLQCELARGALNADDVLSLVDDRERLSAANRKPGDEHNRALRFSPLASLVELESDDEAEGSARAERTFVVHTHFGAEGFTSRVRAELRSFI